MAKRRSLTRLLHGGNAAALPNPFCTQTLPDAFPLHQFKLHSPQAGVPSISTLEEPTQDLRGTLPHHVDPRGRAAPGSTQDA